MSNAGYGNHDAPKPGAAVDATAPPRRAGPQPGSANSAPASDTMPAAVDRRDVATPGDGAGPSGPQGHDVDPGVG